MAARRTQGKRAADGGTIEVAHEALFREWGRLSEWLEPERERLEPLRFLTIAANNWSRHDRAPSYLIHRSTRLHDALGLLDDERFSTRIEPAERYYLAQCAETERATRRRRTRQNALLATLALAMVLGSIAWLNQARLKERYVWYFRMQPTPSVQAAARMTKRTALGRLPRSSTTTY